MLHFIKIFLILLFLSTNTHAKSKCLLNILNKLSRDKEAHNFKIDKKNTKPINLEDFSRRPKNITLYQKNNNVQITGQASLLPFGEQQILYIKDDHNVVHLLNPEYSRQVLIVDKKHIPTNFAKNKRGPLIHLNSDDLIASKKFICNRFHLLSKIPKYKNMIKSIKKTELDAYIVSKCLGSFGASAFFGLTWPYLSRRLHDRKEGEEQSWLSLHGSNMIFVLPIMAMIDGCSQIAGRLDLNISVSQAQSLSSAFGVNALMNYLTEHKTGFIAKADQAGYKGFSGKYETDWEDIKAGIYPSIGYLLAHALLENSSSFNKKLFCPKSSL